MKFSKMGITSLVLIVFLVPIGLLGILINKSQKSEKISSKIENVEENINNEKYINVALFGLDKRSENEKARSDSIIIANINFEEKKINVVSILRDTLVDIEGYGSEKLNHAYAYGGAPLALKTINSNFNLNIDKYVAIDFFGLAKAIDIIGGVDIELKDYEGNQINNNLVEINNIEGLPKGTDYIKGYGLKTLNGRQAVAYSRIRKEGNGDYERTQRQRKVLMQLINKVQGETSEKKFEIGMEIMGQVSTNLSMEYIKNIASRILHDDEFDMNQYRVPQAGT
ncbi:LCP family protein, partial [Romboutsia sp.]|uniref:LCP family protein n=1 Tax=Romboutsia sp. TaxID=1965302 RepID=UPI002B69B9B1